MTSQLKGATAIETHSAILDLIRSSGVVSRTELANRSGLTGASISRVVKQLMTQGLVVETGLGDATGGKRRTLLQLNAGSRHAVGISLDFAAITYVVTDLAGRVVARLEAAGIGSSSPRQVIDRVAEELLALLADMGVRQQSLIGVGVAVAGRQDSENHMLRSNPQGTDWETFALERTLGSASGLPVVVENDSTCAAIGEFWVGRIPASADFATIYMATGFGLGLVTGGDVYRGSSSNVGEIGHMVLDVNGPPCWCGSRGCLEALAAPKRIVELAMTRPDLAAALDLSGRLEDTRADAREVFRAAAAGEPAATSLVELSASYLATALLSITNLLDLDQIILAGPGFDGAGEIYLRTARGAIDRLSFVRNVHPTRIELSTAGPDSAALGAASLLLHSRLTPHQTSRRLTATS